MEDLDEGKIKEFESRYVKSTYDAIAKKFSDTRYKKWPQVDSFMKSLDEGSLVLDVGCGNGKYLDYESTINIGCDLSSNLMSICKERKLEVVQCDMMRLPFRACVYDHVICIASLHHIATAKRRQSCLRGMVDMLRKGGRLFIQVWSFEQKYGQENKYLKKNQGLPSESTESVRVCDSIDLSVHQNRTQFKSQEMLVPFDGQSSDRQLRYYHLFKEGELEVMIGQLSDVTLLNSFNDNGNWCALLEAK